jgi:predicted AAA+ superfamily ATPase
VTLRPRIATKRVTALLRRSPALAILGARQSGKSTLARLAFPDFAYIDLERPIDLTRAAQDPEFLLSQSPRLVIDEAQRLPELFPVLRSHLDRQPLKRAVLSHPKAGASFETFCIEQLLLHAQLHDPAAQGFFYRTHTGQEVDLLLQVREKLLPIEIKLGVAVPDLRGLQTCMHDLGLAQGYVVNLTSHPVDIRRGIWMGGLRHLLARLDLRPLPQSGVMGA